MIDAVIFDIDGTVIDSVDHHAKAWLWAFARHGHDIPLDQIRTQIGKVGDQLLSVFLTPEEIAHFGETLKDERSTFFKDEYLSHLHPFPMVRELFEQIRADGKRVGLASSARADELDRYIEIAGIGDLIEPTAVSGDAEKSNAQPDIFEAALSKLGNPDPERVIVVADSPRDVIAAGKAGLRTIGVLSGGFPEDSLRAAHCVAIFLSPANLLAWYAESPLGRGHQD